jgi:thiamine biosynthesis lipoprotein
LSLAVGAAGLAAGCAERSVSSAGEPQKVTLRRRALGALMEITALHADAARAERAIEAAFAEIDVIEEVMSLYRPASQLCRLNREGWLADPHPHLVTVLRAAGEMSDRSGGKFDVTVQPLWQLHAAAAKAGREPTADEVGAARAKIDWRDLAIGERQVRFRRPGMAATLNGIAQGFAADRASAVLREQGIEQALINAGELAGLGRKADGTPWRVGIQHPREASAWLALADLDGRCLATSGDYATNFGSFDRHHLLDPATGRPANHYSSVSVVAPTGLAADGLSTALFLLGETEGQKLLRATPGADLLVVRKDGSVQSTPGFPLVREEARS